MNELDPDMLYLYIHFKVSKYFLKVYLAFYLLVILMKKKMEETKKELSGDFFRTFFTAL